LRRFSLVFSITILLIASANAAEFRPFFGLSSCTDIVHPLYGLQSTTRSSSLEEMIAYGTQTEIGADFGNYSVFLGYHFFSSTESWTDYDFNRWKEKRVLLGFRWHGYLNEKLPIKPMVGFTVSYGLSTLYQWEEGWFYSSDRTIVSGNSLGQMLELGILVRTKYSADIIIATQVQRLEASFDIKHDYPPNHYVVIIPALRLGLQYRFPHVRI
jgi:hypothetical protein